MFDINELKKYDSTFSSERLASYFYSPNDTIEDAIKHKVENIIMSKTIYSELREIELILRNSIDYALKTYISETWMEDEINQNLWLDSNEYKTLVKAYNDTKDECKTFSKQFTIGKVVANLTLGFWTNLCSKKYNSQIWNKPTCFYSTFPRYPHKHSIGYIANKLRSIRRFRNRVCHHEKIFQYPQKTLNMYNEIMEILSYLPKDDLEILKKTSNFLNTYNQLTNQAVK